MGGSSSKDVIQEAAHKALDISRHLTPEQHIKHVDGECLEGCLLELPWEMYYNTVTLYQTVDASFNFIGTIPSELSLHVPHLRDLDLSHNQLTSLPHTFQLLLHLRTLSLAYNRFKLFPATAVFKLPHLHTLDISYNALRELPQQGWQQLVKLERLNLSHNQLHLLPNSMCLCGELTVLVVKGNPLMHPPAYVCSEGSAAILQHLRRQMASEKTAPSAATDSPVFKRVRGDHVAASVHNPESAWRQYQQGSYTGPGKKRKCPLMPPKDAQALPPHKITQALLGLVYGAAVAEAVGLSCEGLSPCETQFYYSTDTLAPDVRIKDFLRSHYPRGDWGPMADIMVTTLESVLRWGGVVDELEWAAQTHQWTVQGLPEVDDRHGHPISPLLNTVLGSPGYAVNPYAAAEALYRRLTSEMSAASVRQAVVSDAFTVNKAQSEATSGGEDEPPLHPNDNSCLPPALVLGLPSFCHLKEVESNADRICRASHASPCARAAAVLTAAIVACVLQGRFEGTTLNAAAVEQTLDDLFSTAVQPMPDSLEKAIFVKLWTGDLQPREATLPSSHVAYTLAALKKAIMSYWSAVFAKAGSSEPEGGHAQLPSEQDGGQGSMSNNTPGSALNSSTVNEGVSTSFGCRESLLSSPVETSQLNTTHISGIHTGGNHRPGEAFPGMHIKTNDHIGASTSFTHSNSSTEAACVFKKIVSEMCMEGGWGVCAQSCVIGGVLGAFGGFDALPTDWMQKLRNTNCRYLSSKANLLLDLFGLP